MDKASLGLVAGRVRESGKHVVWVEGYSGAGKTNFAFRLAHELGWMVVELDSQLLEEQPETPSYADKIDRTRLAQTFARAREWDGVVVDGVCLRDVAQSFLQRGDSFAVYVARVSAPTSESFMWHDGFALESADGDEPWLWQVIHEYHRRQKPHVDADQILLRIQ